MGKSTNNVIYGTIIASFLTIIFIILLYYNAINQLTDHFFKVFFYLGLGSVILSWGSVFVETKINKKVFVFNEEVPGNKISKFPLAGKLLIGVGLTLLFSLGAIGLKSPIIDLPPAFTEVAFSQVTQLDKVFNKGFVPGSFEEFTVYTLVILLFFIMKSVVRNPKKWVILMLFCSFIGAGVLTQGHRLAYGSDTSAYIGVFMFEWVVQFANLYTGAFISWIPHIGHNAVIVLGFMVAFNIGGVMLSTIPIQIKKRRVKHYEKNM